MRENELLPGGGSKKKVVLIANNACQDRDENLSRPAAEVAGEDEAGLKLSCLCTAVPGARMFAGQKQWFRKGCKPIFVCAPCGAERIICLSSQYPGPVPLARDRGGPPRDPLLGLAPDGVFRAPPIARRAVGSYPAFSPLPQAEARGGLLFCGTVRQPRLSPRLPECIPRLAARVTRHRALWSSDFPPPSRLREPGAILRPSGTAGRVRRGT